MDEPNEAASPKDLSRFNEKIAPPVTGNEVESGANLLGIVAGGAIPFLYAVAFMLFESPSRHTEGWMEVLCIPIFGATEIALLLGMSVSIGIAVKMYSETCRFWARNDNLSDYKMSIFNVLASRHKHLSQLWFNIALAIFLGGLMYAAFHVMEASCKDHFWTTAGRIVLTADLEKNGSLQVSEHTDWADLLAIALPNIFLYSIFFVGWGWALRNYRAHWHNFVTNEHRYASLRAIDRIRQDSSDVVRNQLDLQQAVVVLVPAESAYLEGEGDKEITAGERLVKVEEAVRGLMAHGR
jgi:hypothetical protein